MREKTSVAKETVLRYGKAKKREKESILDELVALTSYNRKYAMVVRPIPQVSPLCRPLVAGGET